MIWIIVAVYHTSVRTVGLIREDKGEGLWKAKGLCSRSGLCINTIFYCTTSVGC